MRLVMLLRSRILLLAIAASIFGLPALAQGAPAGAGPGIMQQLLFFVPLILIFYFLLIRPQQQRAKKHLEMITGLKRGDTVVTSGGLIGKINKVADGEVTLDLADNVRVRVIKSMIVEVRNATPTVAAAND
jgi:preprotein translocase subunit YajC